MSLCFYVLWFPRCLAQYLAWSKRLQYLLNDWIQSLGLPDMLDRVTCTRKLLMRPDPKDTNNILSRFKNNMAFLGSWAWYVSSSKMDTSHYLDHGEKRIIYYILYITIQLDKEYNYVVGISSPTPQRHDYGKLSITSQKLGRLHFLKT